ncbi:MAG TPA: hydrogenase maturation nickel metallochaperone HypA [Coriobacteriia bacterium]|nr:hydrogenase maturation nickel metallochaperone HypA [Coriobacteriia bacterium]
MHEMGITQGILSASFEAAETAGAQRITEIRISVGELTEVVEFALQFAFESLTPGTMAEGATLIVTQVSARSRCNQCETEFDHDRFQMLCPECESMDVTLLQGRELQIDSIEADDEPPAVHLGATHEPPDAADDEEPVVAEGLIDFDPNTVEE